MKRGAPTKYDSKLVEQVYNLCLLGKTNEEIAEALEITNATLHNWMNLYPDFLDAIKRGKVVADGEVVNSLRNRAMNGDTTACIFWLKNRQPKTWRDKQDIEMSVTKSPFELFTATIPTTNAKEKEEE